MMLPCSGLASCFFFFNDTATTEIYTLSLHDALPILTTAFQAEVTVCPAGSVNARVQPFTVEEPVLVMVMLCVSPVFQDRKSTRLNSSHANISYAVFCLKKKKTSKLTNHYVQTECTGR